MVAYTTRNSRQKTYHYYRCSNREHQACSNMKHRPARDLEIQVKDALQEAFHPEAWAGYVDDMCERRLSDLHKLYRPDAKENLAKRIVTLETKISRARDLFIDGDLPRPEYDERKFALQDEIELLQTELSKITDLDDEIRRVEDLRLVLKGIEDPLSGHYALTEFPDSGLSNVMDEDIGYGSRERAARRRQEFYRQTGMRVKVGAEELAISLGVGEPIVSKLDTASASSFGSTSC
jgi:hypothetical protein